ncbi:MAG TPA: hypothetical protein VLH09_12040, partial [Bryobacteraceae bacterium]|nr:hypothetical protein [Bryobacteraceae bacterium]
HTPLKMTCEEVQAEIQYAWTNAYSPAATRSALESMAAEPAPYKISHLVARLFFRGIYFPPKGAWGWLRLLFQNRGAVHHVIRESFTNWRGSAPAKRIRKLEVGLPGREPDAV